MPIPIQGTVKLCDFGYAHRHDPAKTLVPSEQVVGTMEYLPPEYAQGRDSGPLRDIWAVGILAFEMLAGRTPFEGLKENEKWTKLLKVPPLQCRLLPPHIWSS
jgi:serine/threonine protein kinase